MSIIELKNQLDAQFAAIVPPYTGTNVRQGLAEAVHAGVAHPVSLAVTHGVMAAITSPGGTPRGFTPIDAYDGSGNPLGIASYLVNRTGGGSGPIVGVTVRYAPPLGEVSLERASVQSIADTSILPVQFTSRISSDFGNISCNVSDTSGAPNPVNSRIVCAVAGIVHVTCAAIFNSVVDNGLRYFWIGKNGNGSTNRWGVSATNVLTAAGFGQYGAAPSAQIEVSAGDYLQMFAYQESGAALDILGGANGPRFQARYVAPPQTQAGTVRGIVWDG